MHSKKEIIENQKEFRDEIISSLKSEFRLFKKELVSIETEDEEIKKAKEKIEKRLKKIQPNSNVEQFLISKNNTKPAYYAWWDITEQKLQKFKFNK